MHSKAAVQAWLGAALVARFPSAEVSGGARRSAALLSHGDRSGDRRTALLECVGSTPMLRYARSSRIDKNQVIAYAMEPQFAPWRNRVFFVLGHPGPAARSLPISDAESYLRCIALEDVYLHVARTGRGTINSDLLKELEHAPSAAGHQAMVIGLAEALAAVASDVAIGPSDPRLAPEDGESHMWWRGFLWMGRPAPLFVRIPAS